MAVLTVLVSTVVIIPDADTAYSAAKVITRAEAVLKVPVVAVMIAIAVTALWVAVVITQVVAELTVLTIVAVIVVAAVVVMVVVTENKLTDELIETKVICK